jgi:hypothetical protein
VLPFVNEGRDVPARTRPPQRNGTVSSLFPCGGVVLRRAPGAAQPAGEPRSSSSPEGVAAAPSGGAAQVR